MGKHRGGRLVREAPFVKYMNSFRAEMGRDVALLIGEYDRVHVAPYRIWCAKPWWRRIFSSPVLPPEPDDAASAETAEPEMTESEMDDAVDIFEDDEGGEPSLIVVP